MPRKNQPRADDELSQRLRASLRGKRSWSLRSVVILLLVVAALAALLVWILYPAPDPPPMVLVAVDGLSLPGEALALRARLEPAEPTGRKADLRGCEVSFEVGVLAETTAAGTAKTGVDGEATVEWPSPKEARLRFFTVRYAGDAHHRPLVSQGRIFLFEPKATCLVVDVAVLAPINLETWKKQNVLDISLAEDAARALQAAQRQGHNIVYVAPAAETMPLYTKMRGWIEMQAGAGEALPPGPVLAPRAADFGKSGPALRRLVEDVKTRWKASVICVVANAEPARAAQEAGARVILIGADAVEPPILCIDAWSDFGKALADVK